MKSLYQRVLKYCRSCADKFKLFNVLHVFESMYEQLPLLTDYNNNISCSLLFKLEHRAIVMPSGGILVPSSEFFIGKYISINYQNDWWRRRDTIWLHCAQSLAAQCIVIGPVCNGRTTGGRCPHLLQTARVSLGAFSFLLLSPLSIYLANPAAVCISISAV